MKIKDNFITLINHGAGMEDGNGQLDLRFLSVFSHGFQASLRFLIRTKQQNCIFENSQFRRNKKMHHIRQPLTHSDHLIPRVFNC